MTSSMRISSLILNVYGQIFESPGVVFLVEKKIRFKVKSLMVIFF